MKNQANKTILTIIAAMLLSMQALAGNEKGNGGGAWVCREPNGTIRWAKLVDLWEGREEWELNISEDSTLSVDDQIKLVELKIFSINQEFYGKFTKHLKEVKKIFKIMEDPATGITLIDDWNRRIYPKPPKCQDGSVQPEQLANYTSYGKILVDQEIFNSLKSIDQAALYVHEAVYALLRETEKAEDSDQARLINGYLFSDTAPETYKHLLQLRSTESLPAPSNPSKLASLIEGKYGSKTRYCGMEISKDVETNQIFSVGIDNPYNGQTCYDATFRIYQCSSDRADKCTLDLNKGSCRISVINSMSYYQHCSWDSGKSTTTKYDLY